MEEPNYLLVAVERGRNLASVSAAASPYAVVEHGGAVMETAPVAGTTHPIWGAHFLFEVHTTAKEVLIVIKDSKAQNAGAAAADGQGGGAAGGGSAADGSSGGGNGSDGKDGKGKGSKGSKSAADGSSTDVALGKVSIDLTKFHKARRQREADARALELELDRRVLIFRRYIKLTFADT